MNIIRLQQARRLFSSPYVPASQNRRNAVKWAKSLRMLGSKWVGLSQPAYKGVE